MHQSICSFHMAFVIHKSKMEAEKGATGEQRALKDPPARYKAPVWKHFRLPSDKTKKEDTKPVCKHCSTEISWTGGNTTNMSNHLKREHSITCSEPKRSKKESCTKPEPTLQVDIQDIIRRGKLTREREQKLTLSIGNFIA